MGEDKALLIHRGKSLLQHAHDLLEPHVGRVFLSTGSEERYGDMGLDCILDAEPGMGPIGGLQAVLRHSSTPWVLIVACDLPALSADSIRGLLRAVEVGDRAILYGTPETPEPLFALYHKDWLARVDAAVQSGRRRMTSFLGTDEPSNPDGVRWLPLPEGFTDLFANLNHPEDWHKFQGTTESGNTPDEAIEDTQS